MWDSPEIDLLWLDAYHVQFHQPQVVIGAALDDRADNAAVDELSTQALHMYVQGGTGRADHIRKDLRIEPPALGTAEVSVFLPLLGEHEQDLVERAGFETDARATMHQIDPDVLTAAVDTQVQVKLFRSRIMGRVVGGSCRLGEAQRPNHAGHDHHVAVVRLFAGAVAVDPPRVILGVDDRVGLDLIGQRQDTVDRDGRRACPAIDSQGGRRCVVVHEPRLLELPEGERLAGLQRLTFVTRDMLAVEQGAIPAVEVAHAPLVAAPPDDRMLTRDPRACQLQIGGVGPADGGARRQHIATAGGDLAHGAHETSFVWGQGGEGLVDRQGQIRSAVATARWLRQNRRMLDDPLHDAELAAWAASFGLASEAFVSLTVLLTRRTEATGRPAGTPLPPRTKEPASLAARFRLGDVLGVGGMGEVRRAHDTLLDRSVALKIAHHVSEEASRRFLAEARVGAALQHPGIIPVYDSGVLPDGRRWLAMREVEGRRLGDLMAAARKDPSPATALRRLMSIFTRVSEAVGFAHARGVIHLDLKPSNVMVGQFGEVIVLDWGIARRVGGEGCDTAKREVGGTPGYMSPEQSAGGPLDARSDVFALGCILGGMLATTGVTDDELGALRERCVSALPADRPRDGAATAEAAAAWLDGARRKAEAQALTESARQQAEEAGALLRRAAALEAQADALLRALPTYASAEEKAPGWALEDQASTLRQRADAQGVDVEQQLHAALTRAPDLTEAREMLADYYRDRVVDAEAARDGAATAEFEARLRAVDADRHRVFLGGRGQLSLDTEPAGAAVWWAPYVTELRRLVVGEERLLGHTPLRGIDLPRGSHRLRLEADGYTSTIYPIHLGRGEHWDGRPPGESDEPIASVPLPPAGWLRPEWCYVPPGWFYCGGDREAVDGMARRRIWVDGFVIERDPLTYGELIEALNRMVDAGRADLAEKIAPPPVQRRGGGSDGDLSVERTDGGRYWLDVRAAVGGVERWPVTHLSWHAASAWGDWRADTTGLPWRLPHDLEREKAARGADGRFLPWGDFFDPTWAQVLGSRAGRPRPAPVGEPAGDISPYGVRGLAGNVRDWCLNAYHRQGLPLGVRCLEVRPGLEFEGVDMSHRMVRGGGYGAKPEACRSAGRLAAPPDTRLFYGGVRLVMPYPPSAVQSEES